GDVVLVTGTTGALGSYLLAELVSNPEVSRIYALNRPHSSHLWELEKRQEKSLLEKGMEANSILGSDKVKLLEADVALPRFGLGDEVYKAMRSSVTHIIHNAWPVNFTLALASFDTNIKGLRNLIDFALMSFLPCPPKLLFTSSSTVFQSEPMAAQFLPEAPISPEVAIGPGYTEAKWVAEEVLLQATKRSKLMAVIVRVAQLSGGLNGAWKTAEWVPALVQSGRICGCLPADEKNVDWVPVHIAAKSLIDFRTCDNQQSCTIVHLVHPRPTSWSSLARILASDLSIPLVPFVDWLTKLEQCGKIDPGTTDNQPGVKLVRALPALRMLSFFRFALENAGESGNALGFPSLLFDEAVRLSTTLSDTPPLGESDARMWLKYWRSV
ncbi:hypothetical protein GALMADRAFT_36789, partial [Galerina marginata CBS 339.88]